MKQAYSTPSPMPSPEEQKLLLYTSNVHKKREERGKETTIVENQHQSTNCACGYSIQCW